MNTRRFAAIAAAACLAALAAHAAAATPKRCAGAMSCVETRSFTAAVTNFRTSTQGRHRVLTATVRFENTSGKPLTLGYVRDSGVALDDLGNRYVVPGPGSVRAIGEVYAGSFDPKFTLQPGEASDTRFELTWEPGKAIVGTAYEVDLAVREIAPVTGDQFKLGQEHALHFAQLAPASPAAAAKPAVADPCNAAPRCYNAGAFIAEIMQVSASKVDARARHQQLTFNVRFRNISAAPVVLGYRARSSAVLDNFGNAYHWGRAGAYDTSVKGMGVVDARNADTQFALSPGQTRNATFTLIRYDAKAPFGVSYSYDVVIDELEILAGQQVRSVRENSLSFAHVTAGTFNGVATAASAATGGVEGAADAADATDAASKVIDLFNKLKRQ